MENKAKCDCNDCIHYDQCEIKLILHNHSKSGMIKIKKGDKVGQLILMMHNPHHTWDYRTTTDERISGFGSTGK